MEQQKRKPKNPITFGIELNEEQRAAKDVILHNKITVLRGSAGSGKSMLAAQVALDLLFRKETGKIVLTRPTVTAGEEIGFMPGDINSKLAPYTAAIYDNMYRLYNRDKIDSCIHEGLIEVIPLAFMRGRNMSDCVVVVDEAQNITDKQMELMLGRLCKGAKMILCGDMAQIDLKANNLSGFGFICEFLKDIPGFAVVTLKQNHRDPIVEEIIKVYERKTIDSWMSYEEYSKHKEFTIEKMRNIFREIYFNNDEYNKRAADVSGSGEAEEQTLPDNGSDKES